MAAAFRPGALPARLRPLVARALARGEGHEDAIDAIEGHLAGGGERSPDLLVALAMLTYEDAAAVVLGRLRDASERALALIDEALSRGPADADELERVRAIYARTLRRERARERRLRDLVAAPERAARSTELAELAHRILMSGEDDGLAARLMAAAAERARPPSEATPTCATGT